MELTPLFTPSDEGQAPKENSKVEVQGLDAKGLGETSDNGISSLSHSQLELLVKSKVALFVRELDGFSQWQAKHILECVREELG